MYRVFLNRFIGVLALSWMMMFGVGAAVGQSTSGSVSGTVTDSTGAVIPGATVVISNPVSGLSRTATADSSGAFQFFNLPFNPYHLVVSEAGFQPASKQIAVNSNVLVTVAFALQVATSSQSVTVEASDDMVENDPTFHTDIDRAAFQKLPLESNSSSLSSLVTLASPGVAADSNGLFHGLGDHASNSFSIDGQPITDQQSKVFSNQLPSNSVQSLEVISGAPPAEYGGKTSLVIDVTTRSGMGVTTPTGSVSTSYGSFGSSTGSFDISYGGKSWGNFFEIDGLDTGRFLDPPEFKVFHDKGNEFNFFDRADRQLSARSTAHLNLNVSRSWFQTPNSLDNLNVQNVANTGAVNGGTSADPLFVNVGNTDQRSKIVTFDIAPSYTLTLNQNSVFNIGGYVRRDAYNYYASDNPLADLGPVTLQNQSISQSRSLTNAGVHADISYVKGINNIKLGGVYSQTFLRENDTLGIVNNTFNSPCMDVLGNPLPGYASQNQCPSGTSLPNGNYLSVLAPYDLTRGGSLYNFDGHTDVKELGLYLEDQIAVKNWLLNLGIRGDLYNGLAIARQAEPRVGISYNVKKTATILRLSYARTLESPFNENLVLSSQGCANAVLSPLLACQTTVGNTLEPGFRNEFHAGFQQAAGKHLVFSGEYIWKYTHNAFDFSVLGNTPITFPIDWHNSKIPGYMLHADVPVTHGFSAFWVASSVAARFYGPQVAGAGATSGVAPGDVNYPFRIDHDEKFNQTTHFQYQLPGARSPWVSFNWRYDSGLVAGSAPCYNVTDPNGACPNSSFAPDGTPATLNGQPAVLLVDNGISGSPNPVTGAAVYLPFTPDQEFQAGLSCDGVKANGTNQIGELVPGTNYYACEASQLTSTLISIPAPGTGSNDHNPPRIAPRNLFDVSVGQDNLFKGTRYKWSAMLTAVNITNKYALYNFLSTFSGTHYVTPRSLTAEVAFHF
ncbi:carboxypeptidase regulatory-like domain-containing protein [Granulicella sp. L46]|uniref:carboxypeptidase regulatory-like domain-containing protein n=1 Tax=Granulicella sp. L46 TaxID=1641865 RepID=UPI00131C6B0B|nr:carboxypeptidase regulatory-like domain-containing protein [Granulicella sp. L46]